MIGMMMMMMMTFRLSLRVHEKKHPCLFPTIANIYLSTTGLPDGLFSNQKYQFG
jgi:hypothetical protein